jgi:hypothetical protein
MLFHCEKLTTMKKVLLLLTIFYSQNSMAQKISTEGFIRLPQVVNINLTNKTIRYTPVVSTGLTLRYRGGFADFGVFMDKSDFYGYYTYFGSSVYAKPLDDKWRLVTNWFGEITFLPDQSETKQSWIYTIGLSPVLLFPFPWGTFAIALTMGSGFNNDSVSLNTRLILNCSIPLSR